MRQEEVRRVIDDMISYLYIASFAFSIYVAEICFVLAEVDVRMYHICTMHEPGCMLSFLNCFMSISHAQL